MIREEGVRRDAAQPRRAPGSCGRDHARPAGPGGGGGGALRARRTRPRSWRSSRRPATCWRSPTARSSRPTTAPSRARTRPAPRSRSSRPRRCCATGSTSATRSSARPRSRPAGASSRTSRAAQPVRVPFSRRLRGVVQHRLRLARAPPRPDALTRTARDYGLGRTLELALPAAGGEVPPGEDAVERAAAMIGQHEIVASPLAMALVAADGRRRPLARAPPARRRSAEGGPGARWLGARHAAQPDAARRHRGLRHRPRRHPGEVRGKSGTAEFGGGDPPPTHAWFIAFRDDVASRCSSSAAAPAARWRRRSRRASSTRSSAAEHVLDEIDDGLGAAREPQHETSANGTPRRSVLAEELGPSPESPVPFARSLAATGDRRPRTQRGSPRGAPESKGSASRAPARRRPGSRRRCTRRAECRGRCARRANGSTSSASSNSPKRVGDVRSTLTTKKHSSPRSETLSRTSTAPSSFEAALDCIHDDSRRKDQERFEAKSFAM